MCEKIFRDQEWIWQFACYNILLLHLLVTHISLLLVMFKSTSLTLFSPLPSHRQRYLMERLFNERWNEISLMTMMGASKKYRGWIDIDASSFFRFASFHVRKFHLSYFFLISTSAYLFIHVWTELMTTTKLLWKYCEGGFR